MGIGAAASLFGASGACTESSPCGLATGGYGTIPAFGTCSSPTAAARVAPEEVSAFCPVEFPPCSGKVYALCDGSAWTACNCGLPMGYVVVKGLVLACDGGPGAQGDGS